MEFLVCSQKCEREREREGGRETKIRGKKDIIIANIYIYINFIV